jgi:hypothetical protein
MTANAALAATLGMSTRELAEYRYQQTRTVHAVYAVGETYYCARAKQPTELGIRWKPLADQFWAKRAGTVVWSANEQEAK